MAAPVIASTGALNYDGNPGVPSGVSSGSLVVGLVAAYWLQAATAPTISSITVTGFTVDDVVSVALTGKGQYFAIFRLHKYATGADSGTYTLTTPQLGGQDCGGSGGVFRRITGGPTSGNPWVDTFLSGNRTTNGTSITIASHTPGADNSLMLAASLLWDASTTTWPSGWTRDVHDMSDGTLDGGSASQTTATATGTLSWASATSTQGIVALSTIRPPASVVTGTGALVLPGFKTTGSGTVINPITGTGALHLPAFTASGSGTVTVPAITGTGALTLPALTADGSGTVTTPGVTGTGALTLPSFIVDGTGTVTAPSADVTGTGNLVLPGFTIDGSGDVGNPGPTGTGELTLPMFTVTGAGIVYAPGVEPIIPVKDLTTQDILYGDRVTDYRWEALTHNDDGTDSLLGILDGVVDTSATISWTSTQAIKGGGQLDVADLDTAQPGFLRIADLNLESVRLRPVCVIDGLPEIPFSVYLISAATEHWTDTGRVWSLEILDRCTVLDQDAVEVSYAVAAGSNVLTAVATVVSAAGEQLTVDASITVTLAADMVWAAGTTKLQIANDLLSAAGYNALWVDAEGLFQVTPYVVPANRSLTYELLGIPRELVDGESSIYSPDWDRDKDAYSVPNKVIAVQAATGSDTAALTGVWTNEDPSSPFSFPSRGRWITSVLSDVDVPDFSADPDPDASTVTFLQGKAQQSLIASSAVQATVQATCLPVPLRVTDVVRFASTPAGIDGTHVATSIDLDAYPLGLMKLKLQEALNL